MGEQEQIKYLEGKITALRSYYDILISKNVAKVEIASKKLEELIPDTCYIDKLNTNETDELYVFGKKIEKITKDKKVKLSIRKILISALDRLSNVREQRKYFDRIVMEVIKDLKQVL